MTVVGMTVDNFGWQHSVSLTDESVTTVKASTTFPAAWVCAGVIQSNDMPIK